MIPKEKYTLEDVLQKVIRGTTKFTDLDGFIRPEMNVLCKFLEAVSAAPSPSKTTSTLLAWQELTDNEQSRLLEHYNRHQLVTMAIAFCNVVEAREVKSKMGMMGGMLPPDLFGKLKELKEKFDEDMRKENEENPDGDEHEKD